MNANFIVDETNKYKLSPDAPYELQLEKLLLIEQMNAAEAAAKEAAALTSPLPAAVGDAGDAQPPLPTVGQDADLIVAALPPAGDAGSRAWLMPDVDLVDSDGNLTVDITDVVTDPAVWPQADPDPAEVSAWPTQGDPQLEQTPPSQAFLDFIEWLMALTRGYPEFSLNWSIPDADQQETAGDLPAQDAPASPPGEVVNGDDGMQDKLPETGALTTPDLLAHPVIDAGGRSQSVPLDPPQGSAFEFGSPWHVSFSDDEAGIPGSTSHQDSGAISNRGAESPEPPEESASDAGSVRSSEILVEDPPSQGAEHVGNNSGELTEADFLQQPAENLPEGLNLEPGPLVEDGLRIPAALANNYQLQLEEAERNHGGNSPASSSGNFFDDFNAGGTAIRPSVVAGALGGLVAVGVAFGIAAGAGAFDDKEASGGAQPDPHNGEGDTGNTGVTVPAEGNLPAMFPATLAGGQADAQADAQQAPGMPDAGAAGFADGDGAPPADVEEGPVNLFPAPPPGNPAVPESPVALDPDLDSESELRASEFRNRPIEARDFENLDVEPANYPPIVENPFPDPVATDPVPPIPVPLEPVAQLNAGAASVSVVEGPSNNGGGFPGLELEIGGGHGQVANAPAPVNLTADCSDVVLGIGTLGGATGFILFETGVIDFRHDPSDTDNGDGNDPGAVDPAPVSLPQPPQVLIADESDNSGDRTSLPGFAASSAGDGNLPNLDDGDEQEIELDAFPLPPGFALPPELVLPEPAIPLEDPAAGPAEEPVAGPAAEPDPALFQAPVEPPEPLAPELPPVGPQAQVIFPNPTGNPGELYYAYTRDQISAIEDAEHADGFADGLESGINQGFNAGVMVGERNGLASGIGGGLIIGAVGGKIFSTLDAGDGSSAHGGQPADAVEPDARTEPSVSVAADATPAGSDNDTAPMPMAMGTVQDVSLAGDAGSAVGGGTLTQDHVPEVAAMMSDPGDGDEDGGGEGGGEGGGFGFGGDGIGPDPDYAVDFDAAPEVGAVPEGVAASGEGSAAGTGAGTEGGIDVPESGISDPVTEVPGVESPYSSSWSDPIPDMPVSEPYSGPPVDDIGPARDYLSDRQFDSSSAETSGEGNSIRWEIDDPALSSGTPATPPSPGTVSLPPTTTSTSATTSSSNSIRQFSEQMLDYLDNGLFGPATSSTDINTDGMPAVSRVLSSIGYGVATVIAVGGALAAAFFASTYGGHSRSSGGGGHDDGGSDGHDSHDGNTSGATVATVPTVVINEAVPAMPLPGNPLVGDKLPGLDAIVARDEVARIVAPEVLPIPLADPLPGLSSIDDRADTAGDPVPVLPLPPCVLEDMPKVINDMPEAFLPAPAGAGPDLAGTSTERTDPAHNPEVIGSIPVTFISDPHFIEATAPSGESLPVAGNSPDVRDLAERPEVPASIPPVVVGLLDAPMVPDAPESPEFPASIPPVVVGLLDAPMVPEAPESPEFPASIPPVVAGLLDAPMVPEAPESPEFPASVPPVAAGLLDAPMVPEAPESPEFPASVPPVVPSLADVPAVPEDTLPVNFGESDNLEIMPVVIDDTAALRNMADDSVPLPASDPDAMSILPVLPADALDALAQKTSPASESGTALAPAGDAPAGGEGSLPNDADAAHGVLQNQDDHGIGAMAEVDAMTTGPEEGAEVGAEADVGNGMELVALPLPLRLPPLHPPADLPGADGAGNAEAVGDVPGAIEENPVLGDGAAVPLEAPGQADPVAQLAQIGDADAIAHVEVIAEPDAIAHAEVVGDADVASHHGGGDAGSGLGGGLDFAGAVEHGAQIAEAGIDVAEDAGDELLAQADLGGPAAIIAEAGMIITAGTVWPLLSEDQDEHRHEELGALEDGHVVPAVSEPTVTELVTDLQAGVEPRDAFLPSASDAPESLPASPELAAATELAAPNPGFAPTNLQAPEPGFAPTDLQVPEPGFAPTDLPAPEQGLATADLPAPAQDPAPMDLPAPEQALESTGLPAPTDGGAATIPSAPAPVATLMLGFSLQDLADVMQDASPAFNSLVPRLQGMVGQWISEQHAGPAMHLTGLDLMPLDAGAMTAWVYVDVDASENAMHVPSLAKDELHGLLSDLRDFCAAGSGEALHRLHLDFFGADLIVGEIAMDPPAEASLEPVGPMPADEGAQLILAGIAPAELAG